MFQGWDIENVEFQWEWVHGLFVLKKTNCVNISTVESNLLNKVLKEMGL